MQARRWAFTSPAPPERKGKGEGTGTVQGDGGRKGEEAA